MWWTWNIFLKRTIYSGIFLSTFLKSVKGSKNSILNWVMKLNLFMLFFFYVFETSLKDFPFYFTYSFYSLVYMLTNTHKGIDCILLSCHVRLSEWIHTLVCLNVEELLTRSMCHIWSLSDCNRIQTHNHTVCEQTLNHSAKLAFKWLSLNDWAVLWLLICTVHLTVSYYVACEFQSESTHYNLPECQGTLCLKQAPYLKFKWRQRDLNPQPFSL